MEAAVCRWEHPLIGLGAVPAAAAGRGDLHQQQTQSYSGGRASQARYT